MLLPVRPGDRAVACHMGAGTGDSSAELVLPRDPRYLPRGLFFLAAFAALYVARDVVLPILIAFVLKLLLQPAISGFCCTSTCRGR